MTMSTTAMAKRILGKTGREVTLFGLGGEGVLRTFGPGGALEALQQARADGRVRHLGITGHHDPAILLEAMRRFAFDTVLVALNAADVHRLPFISTVVTEAARQNMGVIAMKTCSQKRLLHRLSMAEALGYVWSIPGVSLAIVGCETPGEVDENAAIARAFQPFGEEAMRELEGRTSREALQMGYFKRG